MISLEKQIELLADLSINYQYKLEEDSEEWKEFFKANDLAIPFATLYQLSLVRFSSVEQQEMEMENMVRKSFINLCYALNIEKNSKHLSIPDMFRRSPNPALPFWDEETKAEIETLVRGYK
jgi:hypothetical protein